MRKKNAVKDQPISVYWLAGQYACQGGLRWYLNNTHRLYSNGALELMRLLLREKKYGWILWLWETLIGNDGAIIDEHVDDEWYDWLRTKESDPENDTVSYAAEQMFAKRAVQQYAHYLKTGKGDYYHKRLVERRTKRVSRKKAARS